MDKNSKPPPFKLKITKMIGGPAIDEEESLPGTCYVMKKPNPFRYKNINGFGHSDNPNNPDEYND